jgi:hypothetical protein
MAGSRRGNSIRNPLFRVMRGLSRADVFYNFGEEWLAWTKLWGLKNFDVRALLENHTKIISICSDGASPNSTAREPDDSPYATTRGRIYRQAAARADEPRQNGRGAESECARAMAEIERVLHELALTRRSDPKRLALLPKRRTRHPWLLRLLLLIGLSSTRAWISSCIRMG